MRIETERLVLSEWGEGEWTDLRPLATDARVMRFITGGQPWTDTQIQDFVERSRATFRERGFTRWKLEERRRSGAIGFCGIGFVTGEPDPEIGWWLAPEYWGRGLASEAARAAFQDGTGRAGLKRIVSIARPENRASIRIMQKLGMRFERTIELNRIHVVRYAFEANEGV